MTGRNAILCEALNCNEDDLAILDNMNPDWQTVFEWVETWDYNNDLYAIVKGVIETGFEKIGIWVENAINFESNEKVMNEMIQLSPDDFKYNNSYDDVHVYCIAHKKMYQEYFSNALDEFADWSGIEIEF